MRCSTVLHYTRTWRKNVGLDASHRRPLGTSVENDDFKVGIQSTSLPPHEHAWRWQLDLETCGDS